MATKVLVTGAAGLIGQAFFDFIKSTTPYQVIGIDNFSRFPNTDQRDIINADICDWLDTTVNDFDYIYHFAAINGTSSFYKNPTGVIKNNTLIDLSVIEFAETNPNCKLIYSSSSEVVAGTSNYPTSEETDIVISNIHNSRWSYRLPKVLAENYLMNSNIDFAIIRFFNVYGKRSGAGHFVYDIVEKLKSSNFELIGADETRSFCYVEDAVESILLIGETVSKDVVNLGSDREIAILDAANLIATHLRITPEWQFKDSLRGSVKRRRPDLTKIKQLNPNFNPRSLEEIIPILF